MGVAAQRPCRGCPGRLHLPLGAACPFLSLHARGFPLGVVEMRPGLPLCGLWRWEGLGAQARRAAVQSGCPGLVLAPEHVLA